MNNPLRPAWKTSYMATVGLLVRRRKELGLTQLAVAVQLCVGLRTFVRWENGRAEPPSKRLFQWAAALGVGIAPHVAHSGAANGLTEDVERFVAALKEADCSLASLSPDVLVHVMNDDDKSTFIAWFEGRRNFGADDWSMLLLVLRELMPDLFSGRGER